MIILWLLQRINFTEFQERKTKQNAEKVNNFILNNIENLPNP